MTVGQELERLTGFRLFHSHQIFDLVTDYFSWQTLACHRLVMAFRTAFCTEAVRAGTSLIVTDTWDFDAPLAGTLPPFLEPFREQGRICCVELVAPLAVLLQRNETENRLRNKKTDWSTNAYLQQYVSTHRFDSGGAFPLALPHLRLETDNLSAQAASQRIVEHFALPRATEPTPT